MIDESVRPAATWLLAHGFPYDADLKQDSNGDGVSLLLAYALDLDPRFNLQSSLPVPVLDAGTLSLSFHGTSPGVTYTVETSDELQNWTTSGVTQTLAGADQRVTASVPMGGLSRFLRLKVLQ